MDRSTPVSIEAELDNQLIAHELLEASPTDSNAHWYFSECLCTWAERRVDQALDMARRGELEVTPADVLKASEWATKMSSRGEVYHGDAMCVLTSVSELFARPLQEKREKDREQRRQKAMPARSAAAATPSSKRSKRPKATVARRKPKARVRAKAA